ncbi:MAG: RNA polymerase sigma factor [Polyangiaceae bacterium]|nr:RNA polymerase sigma factor [Polyangiaceae bacterium]
MKLPLELPEEQLLPLLQRRDQGAFVAVYRAHAPVVSKVLVRLGIPTQDIEDAVQTTFVEAIAGIERFEGRSSLRSWLLGVALNQARNQIRGRIRQRANNALLAVEATPSASAEELLGKEQQLDRLQQALDRLPPLQREAIVLCELSELPAREVAALLGVPLGTVWRRVHDGKLSLKKWLTEGES